MLQVVKSPLARRLWRTAKALHISLAEAARLTPEELDFCDFSMLADDPKRLEEYENTYYDPDYDEFERAFDEEMRAQQEAETLMRKAQARELAEQGYDAPVETMPDEEWERVE